MIVVLLALALPSGAGAALSTRDNTPFPASRLIVGAEWTGPRYGPPRNQWGDILPTIWADDGAQYTMMDDGGTDVTLPGGFWRQSLARITGAPPQIRMSLVGDPRHPPPHTRSQIRRNRQLWSGPLGPYYSSGLVEADRVFYATQELDWDWDANATFGGLHGIAYSRDHGWHWSSPGKAFPAPIGNLSWVIRGRGGNYADGWVYAIGSEREFNADTLFMGRARPDVADMTDPGRWQWVSGWTRYERLPWPVFSGAFAARRPILSWPGHITYPQMAYDAPLHRYLLSFTYSYGAKPPGIWSSGAELVILEASHPWGPFSFVVREPYFGPSNGYSPGFPVAWISRSGQDLWLKWAANFKRCDASLDCSGGYGFNYRRLHLTLAH